MSPQESFFGCYKLRNWKPVLRIIVSVAVAAKIERIEHFDTLSWSMMTMMMMMLGLVFYYVNAC